MRGRWHGLLAIVSLAFGAWTGPGWARGEGGETAGMLTELKVGRGKVEIKAAGGEWRAAAPLNALRAGDQVRAAGDALAVVLLTGGRGAVQVKAKNSPFTVAAAVADEGKMQKVRALLSASLDFLSTGTKEPPRALLSTRSAARPSVILTPRNGSVLPDALVFEWLGSQFSRYNLRVLDPSGVVLERTGVAGARFAYPADAPPLTPSVRYRFQVEALGHPPYEAWFEIVDAARAAAVREDLIQLEAALGPGVSSNSRTAVRVGALAADGLLHDARLAALTALAAEPDEPMLHMLLATLYLKTGLPQLAAESFDEAQFLLSRERK